MDNFMLTKTIGCLEAENQELKKSDLKSQDLISELQNKVAKMMD